MSDQSIGGMLRKFLMGEAGSSGRKNLSTYSRKGAVPQVRQLTKTRAGRETLGRLGVSDRTMKSWLGGKSSPSKANQAKIHELYDWFAGKEAKPEFPQHVKGRELAYEGPSPWPSDHRPDRSLTLESPNWSAIERAWESGEFFDDDDLADDLAYEGLFDEFGSASGDGQGFPGGASVTFA